MAFANQKIESQRLDNNLVVKYLVLAYIYNVITLPVGRNVGWAEGTPVGGAEGGPAGIFFLCACQVNFQL